jgi:hypothetical protein
VPRTSPLGCDIGAFQSIFTATFLSAPNRVPARRAIKLKATVTGNYSKSTGLGGMVTFLAGSTVLGTVAPNKRGVATLTLAGGTLSKGTYWCSASFSGPVGYHGSASAAVPVIVG